MPSQVRWSLLWCLVLLPALAWGQPGSTLNREAVSIINPLEYGATCTSGTLNAAISGAPASQRELWLTTKDRTGATCVWAITSNVTIPSTMTFRVPKGATASISAGITLAILGPHQIDSANWRSGLGSVSYSLPTMGMQGSFVSTGCLPVVPASSLTMAGFGCVVTLSDGLGHLPLAVPAAAITLANTTGWHWLAVHRDTTTAVTGWTRQAGTHYLHRQLSTEPATVAGMHILARLTVAGSVITGVFDHRHPASFARAGVFDVRDPLYGGVADCQPNGTGTDNLIPFRTAIGAAKEQGGCVHFDGWMCVSDQLTITLDTYNQGMCIEGRYWSRTVDSMPQLGIDSRIWFTSGDTTKALFRFEQTVFSSGGSFMPVILRNFGMQAATVVQGLNRGIKAYGIPIHATNIGANYFNIGIDLEEVNGPVLTNISARKNKATNLRLFSVYEPLILNPYLTEASTVYHGLAAPYTGTALTLYGVLGGLIHGAHLASAPIGMAIDGTNNMRITQPYFESNTNGAGTFTSANIGYTVNNANLQILQPHNQDPSARWNLDRMVGGRLEAGAHVTTTVNTVNVDIVSSMIPTLNPFTDAGPTAIAHGRSLLNQNFAPDGYFIHQPLFSNYAQYMLDAGGTGSSSNVRTFISSPAGLTPGRKYLKLDAIGGTKQFIYPTTLGSHSIHAGTNLYFHVWYYAANTPAASLTIEFAGVNSGGAPVTTNYSAPIQLSATGWTNARFVLPVPNASGLDTLTKCRLIFDLADPGQLHIGTIYAGLRPEPATGSPQDTTLGFQVVINSGAAAAFPDVGPADYLLLVQPQASGVNAWSENVAGHWEVKTTSGTNVQVSIVAIPIQHRGY